MRFVLVRSPQTRPTPERDLVAVAAYPDGLSPFARELSQLGPRAAARAASYLDSAGFVTDVRAFWPALIRFDEWLLRQGRIVTAEARTAATEILGDLRMLVTGKDFDTTRVRMADSLLAVIVSGASRTRPSQHLVRGLQVLELVRRLATGRDGRALEAALGARVVFPRSFPFAKGTVGSAKGTAGGFTSAAIVSAKPGSPQASRTTRQRFGFRGQICLPARIGTRS